VKGESEGEGEGESELEGERECGPDAGVAAVGWARSEAGPGIFYEASGTDAQAVRATVEEGLAAGVALRDWEPVETDVVLRQVEPAADAHATVVVLATYGDSTPLL
jgi:arginine decarboxylase